MIPHPIKIKKITIIIKFDMPSAKNLKEIQKNLSSVFIKFNMTYKKVIREWLQPFRLKLNLVGSFANMAIII